MSDFSIYKHGIKSLTDPTAATGEAGGIIDANFRTIGDLFDSSGISGYSGYSGVGLSGYSGYSGATGANGSAGTSGLSGYSGITGSNGTSGFSGYSGKSGYSGYSGTNGSTGTSGFSGYSGAGTSGFSGYSGYSGKSGYSGYSGAAPATLTYFNANPLTDLASNLFYGNGSQLSDASGNLVYSNGSAYIADAGGNLYFNDASILATPTGQIACKGLVETITTITDGSTISTDATTNSFFSVTLGGNRTLANPTGAMDGQILRWKIKQDGTGSRTLALDTKFVTGPLTITLSTAANKTDYLSAIYDSGADKFHVLGSIGGY